MEEIISWVRDIKIYTYLLCATFYSGAYLALVLVRTSSCIIYTLGSLLTMCESTYRVCRLKPVLNLNNFIFKHDANLQYIGIFTIGLYRVTEN